jgi:hypothetical protein
VRAKTQCSTVRKDAKQCDPFSVVMMCKLFEAYPYPYPFCACRTMARRLQGMMSWPPLIRCIVQTQRSTLGTLGRHLPLTAMNPMIVLRLNHFQMNKMRLPRSQLKSSHRHAIRLMGHMYRL